MGKYKNKNWVKFLRSRCLPEVAPIYTAHLHRKQSFIKPKKLIEKFSNLLDKNSQLSNHTAGLIKPTILNLTREKIQEYYKSSLNLRIKFVSMNKNLPFMDVVTLTESSILNLGYNHKENDAEARRLT